jgi:4-amino-4-deoxy-L-arabinose transferase-like glycosyltransferase
MRDRFWVKLALVALLALTVRVGYIGVAKWSDEVEFSDALYYATQAQVLAEGDGFEHRAHDRPAADHAPLTQISQAPTAVVFGRSVLAQRLVQAVYGTLAVVAVALLARKVSGRDRVALWAGVVAAVYPNLWANDAVIMAETLTVLLVAVLLWAVYGYQDDPRGRWAVLVGALAGLAALSRAELALIGVLAFVPLALRASEPWSRRLGHVALAGVAGALVLAPWTAFNAGRFDEPVLISTNDGLTLIGANCDEQYDGPDPGLWDIACLPPGSFTEAHQRDQSVVNAEYRHLAVEYARDNLGDLPRVAAIRVARTWSLYDPASMIVFNENEGREPPVGWAGFVSFWLLVPFAVGGALLLRERGRTIWPLLSTIVVVTFVSAAFYGLLRFRAPAEVALVVFAAIAMSALRDRRGEGFGRRAPVPSESLA